MKWIFILSLTLVMSYDLMAQTECPEQIDGLSVVKFDLNDCTSFFDDDSHTVYSEFTAQNENNSDCADMLLIGRSLYRNNPITNHHSCTPGFDGNEGMCVSSSSSCDFQNDSDQAIRFDIEVTPGQGKAQLKELKFYEKGPEEFVWIDGETGPNNYPISYGVRITVAGTEIYKRTDIPTNREWTLQTIDLSQVDGFEVEVPTIFSFELLGYCPVGNGVDRSIWDVDDIAVYAGCVTEINGGMLSGDNGASNIDLCVGDAISYELSPVLEFATGSNQSYIVTDANGVIVDLPTGPTFDLKDFGPGVCNLYNVSYEGEINGLVVGGSIDDLDGCFDLSNALVINKITVDGDELNFDIALDKCDDNDDVRIVLSTRPSDLPDGVDPQNNTWEVLLGGEVITGTGNPFSLVVTNETQISVTLGNIAPNGCDLIAQKTVDPQTLPAPEPRFRFEVSDCNESEVSATFISELDNINNMPVASYDWVFFMNNNSFNMSGKSVDVTIPTRFDLMVRLILTLENGCSYTVTESVDFGDVPSLKTFSNPIYVCNGDTPNLVSNPNNDWFYNWVPETGLTFSNSSKSNPVFDSPRSQTYKVTVISPLCSIEEEIEVIVLEDIIIDVIGDLTNCSPRGTLMINNPVNITYEWATNEDFSISLGRGTSIDYDFTGQTVTEIFVRATAPNGCTSKIQKVSINITEGLDLIFTDGGDGIVEVCEGVGGMVIMNPNPDWTYTWSPMTGLTGDLSNPKINPSSPTTYSVTVTSGDCEVKGEIQVVPGDNLDIEIRGLDADGNLNTCAGSANLLAMGMCEPSYEWSTDSNFNTILSTYASINITQSGTYYVRGILENCTSEVEQFDVTLGDGPSIEFTDDGDGVVQVCQGLGGMIVKNPNPAWTYTWSPTTGLSGDLSSPKVNPSETTTYYVTVTDGLCEAYGQVQVVPGDQLDISIDGVDQDGNVNTCASGVVLRAIGNCDPNYEWSTDSGFSNIISTQPNISIKENGTYFVRAIINGDCMSEVEMVEVILGDGPFIEFTDGGDGIVDVCTGVGGAIVLNSNPAWTYTWSPMMGVTGDLSNPKVNPTETTIYTVTVSDGICEVIGQVTVDPTDRLEIEVLGKNGNGEIDVCSSTTTLMVTGSCEPNYEWSRTADFAEIISRQDFLTVNTAETYYVRAVVEGSCTSEIEEIKVTLGDGPGVYFTGGDDGIAEVCGQAGGMIVMEPNPNWTYTWSPADRIIGDPSNPKFRMADNTKYSVTVTDGNCEAFGMIIVQPGDRLEIEIVDEDENGMITECGGEKQLIVRGNCDPNYEWSDTPNFNEILSTSEVLTVTMSGSYYVRAIINDICVSEVEQVDVILGADDLSLDLMGGDDDIVNLCDEVGGMIVLNPNPNWTYTWSPMDGISGDLSNPLVNPDMATTYTVTVSNGNCEITRTFEVVPTDRTEIDVVGLDVNSKINACDSEIVLTVMGNAEGTYEWSTDELFSNVIETSDMITIISAGTFYVRAVVSTGCDSEIVKFEVTFDESDLSIDFMGGDDGTVDLCDGVGGMIVTNPNPDWTYTWSPMDGISGDLSNPLVNPEVTTVYTVTVSDGNCEITEMIEVRPSGMTEIEVLDLDMNNNLDACSSSVDVSVTGNAEGTYEWATDADFTNVIGTESVQTITEAGTYFVRATISTSCISEVIEFTVSLGEGSDVSLEFTDDDGSVEVCEGIGGMVIANPNPEWTYTWSPMDGLSGDLSSPKVNPTETTIYTVTVSDGDCEVTGMIEVVPGDMLTISVSGIDADGNLDICGGSQTVTASGNCEPNYEWSRTPDFTDILSTNDFYNITEVGRYYVRAITGSDDCSSNVFEINAIFGDGPSIEFIDNDDNGIVEVCEGIGGMIIANPNPEWTYTWSPMEGLTGDLSNPKVNPTETTIYNITVTDGVCETTGKIEVVPGNTMEISVSGVDRDGNLDICGGSQTVTAAGNCESNYEWSRTPDFAVVISTNEFYNINEVGTYYVRAITGAESCISEVEIINAILGDGPSLEFTDGGDGTVEVCQGVGAMIIANPNPEWTYTWSPMEGLTGDLSNPKVNPTETTIYNITVTDGVCETIGKIEVVPGNMMEISVSGVDGDGNLEVCGGSQTVTATGNCVPNYEWSRTADFVEILSTQDFYNITELGTYYVRAVTGDDACISEVEEINAILGDGPSLEFTDGGDGIVEVCEGVGGMIIVNPNPEWTYTWSPMEGLTGDLSNPKVNPTEATTYSVTVTDGMCETTGMVEVVPGGSLEIAVQGADSEGRVLVCNGETVTLAATGNCENNYEWSINEDFDPIISMTSELSTQVTLGDVYYVRAVVEGCNSEIEKVTLSDISGEFKIPDGTELCPGDTLTFSLEAVNNPDSINIVWKADEHIISDLNDNEVTVVSLEGDGDITLSFSKITSDGSCMAMDSITIPMGMMMENLEVMTDIDCATFSVCFTTDQMDGDLTWDFGDETTEDDTSTEANPCYTYQGPGEYVVTVQGNSTCGIGEMFIPVLFSDAISISTMSDTINFCEGAELTLSANSDIPQNIYWSLGGLDTIGTGPSIMYSPSSDTTIFAIVTDGATCRDSVSIFLDGYFFEVEVMTPDAICPGEPLAIEAVNNGTDSLTYLWGPEECITAGRNTPTPEVNTELAKDLFLTVTNVDNGCTKEFIIPITISDLTLNLTADPDTIINRGESVDITAEASGDDLEWSWSNGETTETIVVQPEETTTYNVQVTDGSGCEADGTIVITVIQPVCDSSDVYIPSGFSPNGDGANDEMIVRSNFIKEMQLDIYDRWGEKVFETTDQRTGWNGQFQNTGDEMHSDTYAYCLKVTCTNDLSYTMLGNITLVR